MPDCHYSGSLRFAPFHYLGPTAAMAASSAETTTEVGITTGISDHGSLPMPGYRETNYRFNHTTPNTTSCYNPAATMEQLHITEHHTTHTHQLTTTTTTTFSHTLQLLLKSINYFHYSDQHHVHNSTTPYPFSASRVISGCRATTQLHLALHLQRRAMYTTT